MTTRLLKAKDVFIAYYMDELSGFNIASYIDDSNDWAWGLFDKDEHLIGYCTIGCADDCYDAITKHPMYNGESLLLDNVFILPEYRDTNIAIRMISDAVTGRWRYDGFTAPVFLSYVTPVIKNRYELAGFKRIENSNCMVLCP